MQTRPIILATVGLALSVALTGCAGEGTDKAASSPAPSATNSVSAATTGGAAGSAADIAFVQLMVPHHEQAIQLAGMAATNATSPEVKALAAQIRAAQEPEIATMTQWLTGWGAPLEMPGAAGSDSDHGDMDMGGMTASGMMTEEELDELAQAQGEQFDKMWLGLMIAHHQGAVAMARQVSSATTNPQVEELAATIIAGQTAEITTMRSLLEG